MEAALPAREIPDSVPETPDVELIFIEELQSKQLAAGELEVLGSYLPELMSELLQMTYEAKASE